MPLKEKKKLVLKAVREANKMQKEVVNKKDNLIDIYKEISTKSLSVLGWEKEFDEEFSNVGWIPENKQNILAFIASLLLKQKEEHEKKLDEWFDNGYKQCQGELREKIMSLKDKYVGKGNAYENEAYHKILRDLI